MAHKTVNAWQAASVRRKGPTPVFEAWLRKQFRTTWASFAPGAVENCAAAAAQFLPLLIAFFSGLGGGQVGDAGQIHTLTITNPGAPPGWRGALDALSSGRGFSNGPSGSNIKATCIDRNS